MGDNIKEIFGKNLRKEREKRNLTQENFAELIDIGIPALSKIECGKSYPKPETLQKIIDVFHIKPYLLYITNREIDIESAYKDLVFRLDKLKQNRELFTKIYDCIIELTSSENI